MRISSLTYRTLYSEYPLLAMLNGRIQTYNKEYNSSARLRKLKKSRNIGVQNLKVESLSMQFHKRRKHFNVISSTIEY